MPTQTRQPRGYVLVATLAILILAAAVLVGIGRVAVRQATLARQAERDLQLHVGRLSAQKAILPYVESILAHAEAKRSRPVPVLRASVQLTTHRFDLHLSDESAKANVNFVWTQTNPAGADNRIRQSLAGTGLGARVRLRPDPTPPPTTRPTTRPGETIPTARVAERFHAFGQVFETVPPDQLLHRIAGQPSIVETFTCWGGGALNLRRAPEPALRLAAGAVFTGVQIQEILDTRNQLYTPPPLLPSLIAPPSRANQGSPLQQLMRRLIPTISPGLPRSFPWTESSACHSLWIVAQDGRRSWYHLAVLDRTDPHADRTGPRLFAW